MASNTINVLLSTFPGLGLPQTLCLPFAADSTFADVHERIQAQLPPAVPCARLVLSTNSAQRLPRRSAEPLSSLVTEHESTAFLPLRLSAPCLGGKGGFGSQLRAAGGRMSRKGKQGPTTNSKRNLDGRRVRTVDEAKALAEYLAVKPEMDRKEKEERRKRWEAVVEAAERTEQEIKDGTYHKNAQRGDGAWIEEKEDAESKVRDAVLKAMAQGLVDPSVVAALDSKASSEESEPGSEGSGDSDSGEAAVPDAKNKTPETGSSKAAGKARKVWGWDEDDEMSSSDSDDAD